MRKLKIEKTCVEHENSNPVRCPAGMGGQTCTTECAWFSIITVCGGGVAEKKHCCCRDNSIGELVEERDSDREHAEYLKTVAQDFPEEKQC